MKLASTFSLLGLALLASAPALTAGNMGSPIYTPQAPPPMFIPPQPALRGFPSQYVAAYGGADFAQKLSTDSGYDFKSKTGWVAGLKYGYSFNQGSIYRPTIELDGFYNRSPLNLKGTALGNTFGANSDFNAFALMVNGIMRFDLGQFVPYAGAGAGYAWTSVDDTDFTVGNVTRSLTGDDTGGFVWSLMAGCDYYVNPQWSIFGEYKFIDYGSLQGNSNANGNSIGVLNDDFQHHLLSVGVRYGF